VKNKIYIALLGCVLCLSSCSTVAKYTSSPLPSASSKAINTSVNSTPSNGINLAIPIIKLVTEIIKKDDTEKSKQVAKLTFITDTLKKAKNIDLYYSLNGLDWTEVSAKNLSHYQNKDTLFVTDKCPKKGVVHYRIRQSFSDITFVYSDVVTTQVNDVEMALNKISATVVDYLMLDIYSAKTSNCDLKITNVTGKILYAQQLKLITNNNSFSFNIEAFKKGNYYVEIVDPNFPKIISTSFYKN
jgi:hypothetical protein